MLNHTTLLLPLAHKQLRECEKVREKYFFSPLFRFTKHLGDSITHLKKNTINDTEPPGSYCSGIILKRLSDKQMEVAMWQSEELNSLLSLTIKLMHFLQHFKSFSWENAGILQCVHNHFKFVSAIYWPSFDLVSMLFCWCFLLFWFIISSYLCFLFGFSCVTCVSSESLEFNVKFFAFSHVVSASVSCFILHVLFFPVITSYVSPVRIWKKGIWNLLEQFYILTCVYPIYIMYTLYILYVFSIYMY